jgi:carbon-monoxide dehydrogenase medium subunit
VTGSSTGAANRQGDGSEEAAMLLRPEIAEPETVKQAVALLRSRRGAMPLAGATDLIPAMRRGLAKPRLLVNLKRIADLRGAARAGASLRIGATTTVAELLHSPIVKTGWPVLAEVARDFGSPQTRNLATVGGNLCNATPSADLPLPLLVLEARIGITGPAGKREMPLAEFFRGVNKTALRAGELVTAILVPRPSARTGAACAKVVGRRAMDLAVAAAAAAVTLAPDGQTCRRARVALGAVAPAPMRSAKAEAMLEGRKLTPSLMREAAKLAAAEARPVSDLRATEAYRREMTEVLVRRVLAEAARRAGGGGRDGR